MWIHEYKNWPSFTWDTESVSVKLTELRFSQGHLLGRMKGLGFEFRQEAALNTLTVDVVKSSAIEGEKLDPQEVRSSIARNLGIESAGLAPVSRDVEGMVEIMLDATQQFHQPLTKSRLFDWHVSLFPLSRSGSRRITVGNWRTAETESMQVVSGPIGREKVHFQAPNADRVDKEMEMFLNWFDNCHDADPVLKAGVAHLWFVTIHPFEDGNGRIGRAISDLALARADGISERFYSMSAQIALEHREYYNQLESQQRSKPDITAWLKWFLGCLGRAIRNADSTVGNVLYKAHLWERINQTSVNDRQRLIINRMLDDEFKGYMNTSKYAKMAKCSNDTALRDIQDLKHNGIFIQNPSGGRSTSYRLPDQADI